MLQTYQIFSTNLFNAYLDPSWRCAFKTRILDFMERIINECQDETAKANMLISYNNFSYTLIVNYML